MNADERRSINSKNIELVVVGLGMPVSSAFIGVYRRFRL
jgi:hypothetical protein